MCGCESATTARWYEVSVLLRRLLGYRVSVEAMIEVVMWLLVVYVTIGLVWAFFHGEQVQLLDTQLKTRMPAGSDIAAFLTTGALWPWMLFGASICGT
jgi:hypothetical protein